MAILETVTFTTGNVVTLNGFVTDGGYTFTADSDFSVQPAGYANKATGSNSAEYAFINDLSPPTADYSVTCNILFRSTADAQDVRLASRLVGGLTPTGGYAIIIDALDNTLGIFGIGIGFLETASLAGTAYDLSTVSLSTPITLTVELRTVGDQISAYLSGELVAGPVTNSTHTAAGKAGFGSRQQGNDLFRFDNFIVESVSGSDYTARKGSTATITHTLTAAGLTSATLNGQPVTIASQSGQTASISFTDTITTSDVYDLVLGDDVGTQTFTVQYNVIGLTTNTIQKEGTSIGARSDLEMDVLDATGATVLGTLTGLTTDASGITGQTIVPAGSVGDPVRVSGYSEAAGIGFAYKTTLGLL